MGVSNGRRRRGVAAVAAGAVLLAACGDGQETGAPESLAAFFGWDDDPDARQTRWRDEEAQIQEHIRQCMAAHGFEYVPMQPPEESFAVVGPEDEEERVRTEGFGITTWYGNEDHFVADADVWEDPNDDIVMTMSDPEQRAYFAALYGDEEDGIDVFVEDDDGVMDDAFRGFGGGCQGQAYEEVWGKPDEQDDLWSELDDEFEAMWQRIEADPRLVAWNERWSACMAEAGYEYTSRMAMHDTIFEEFDARLNEIVGPDGGFVDPFEGWSEQDLEAFFDSRSDDEINAFFDAAQRDAETGVDQEAVRALQREEIDLAVADVACGEGYWELYEEVSASYEAEFISRNRDVLQQIRDAQGG